MSALNTVNPSPRSQSALRSLHRTDHVGRSHRSKLLPTVFLFQGLHPLRHGRKPSPAPFDRRKLGGRTFVVFVDTTDEGRAAEVSLWSKFSIPLGRAKDIERLYGLVELLPGDWVIGHSILSNGNPLDDIMLGMVCYDSEAVRERAALTSAAVPIVGSQDQRRDGLLAFEKTSYAHRVRPNDRAYGVGEMVQQTRKVEAPAAALKVADGVMDQVQKDEKHLLETVSCLANSTFLRNAPLETVKTCRKWGEYINTPSIGCDDNYMFPSWQLNVAAEQHGHESGSLLNDMQFFGDSHTDDYDAAEGYSVLTPFSTLTGRAGEDPGRFHLLSLGFFVVLVNLINVFFSGRRPHGGTSPLAPEGETAPAHALRCIMIGYPSAQILQGTARHSFGAVPYSGDPIYISPEMTGAFDPVDIVPVPAHTNHSIYARDGVMTMTQTSHVNYMSRALLQFCRSILRQMPLDYGVELDRDIFLSAFTSISNGERVVSSPWIVGPTGPVRAPPTEEAQGIRRMYCEDYYKKMAEFTPTAPRKYPHLDHMASQFPIIESDRPKKKPAKKKYNPRKKSSKRKADAAALLGGGPVPSAWTDAYQALVDDEQSAPESEDSVDNTGEYNSQWSSTDDSFEVDSKDEVLSVRSDTPSISLSSRQTLDREEKAGPSSRKRRRSSSADTREVRLCIEKTIFEEAVPEKNLIEDDMSVDDIAVSSQPSEDYLWLGVQKIGISQPSPIDLNPNLADFLKNMCRPETVPREIAVAHDFRAHIGSFSTGTLSDAMKILRRVDLGDSKPLRGLSRRQPFVHILASIKTMRLHGILNQVSMNLFHQRVMLCETHFVSIVADLPTSIRQQICQLQKGVRPAVDKIGLLPLIEDVWSLSKPLANRPKSKIFAASDYVPGNLTDNIEVTLKAPRFRYTLDDEQAENWTVDTVLSIIREWFAMPETFKAAQRADFVKLTVGELGTSVLLLPAVWEVYEAMPRWLMNTENVTRLPRQFVNTLHDRYRRCLHQECSIIVGNRLLRDLQLLHEAYGYLQAILLREANEDAPTLFMDSSTSSTILATGDIPQGTATSTLGDATQAIVLLQIGLAVAQNTEPIDYSRIKIATEIRLRTDLLQPLREYGISRSRINGRDGECLDTARMKTRSGIFSLLIFRNILYGSEYLISTAVPNNVRRVLFEDFADFFRHVEVCQAYIPSGRTKEQFFCNPNALGKQPNMLRRLDNAELIWTIAGNRRWKIITAATSTVSFTDVAKLLSALDGKDESKIPGNGALCRYLTSADFCYHGIATVPSISEIAEVIWKLKMGALSGLRILRYINNGGSDQKKVDKHMVLEAFTRFYSDVANTLTSKEKDEMGWNTIIAEHLLCKVTRFFGKEA